ncbi:two-component regulator propeller domain-containing protein [Telluribacter sp. SYSU D00476]|uniref:PorZ beta-propeller-like domain-containing protein n=1 Tax=Telluribacter sp. SYSU D00476 TaxID=2811430 RepID=UPI001FF0F0AE|nr:two-component regulator propeller domain-containing protein [Telluribacter sp. SYSU D00476]
MRRLFLILVLLLTLYRSYAQDVPLGAWRTHFSYLSAHSVELVEGRVFCATYNGLFSVNPSDDSTVEYSKATGLSDVGVSAMAYDPAIRLLLLGYRSGNLDLLYLDEKAEPTQILNWPLLRNAADLPENRRVRDIQFHEGLAYLSTSFGVIVLDPQRREVRETYRYIGPAGAEVAVNSLAFTTDSLYAVTSQGLLTTSLDPTINRQFFGNWKAVPIPFSTPRSVAVANGTLYAGFSGRGVYRREGINWNLAYPGTGSTVSLRSASGKLLAMLDNQVVVLAPPAPPTVYQHPLIVSPQDAAVEAVGTLWIADLRNGLLGNAGEAFRSYSPPTADTTIAVRADSTMLDRNGLQWTRLPTYLGGGIVVSDHSTGRQRYLSTSLGNGGLPSATVNSIVVDRDGLVWFASDRGVGYFVPDGVLAGGRIDAVLPIYGQRRLLSSERATALAVEPGNRKWIGTRSGLYLFSPDGIELIQQFTAQNSPLPTDHIRALRFADSTGYLYVDTPNGMVSYRSGATSPEPTLVTNTVALFPNPVRPGYDGVVGVKGLVENTVVKITDLSGRLVHETRSQGGTASWDLRDYTGRRARGGIYLVLLIAPDGTESVAGKLAVVE